MSQGAMDTVYADVGVEKENDQKLSTEMTGAFQVDYESVMEKLRQTAKELAVPVRLSPPPSPHSIIKSSSTHGKKFTRRGGGPSSKTRKPRSRPTGVNLLKSNLDQAGLVMQLQSQLTTAGVDLIEMQAKHMEMSALVDQSKTKLAVSQKEKSKLERKFTRQFASLTKKLNARTSAAHKLEQEKELLIRKHTQDSAKLRASLMKKVAEDGKMRKTNSTLTQAAEKNKKLTAELEQVKKALTASRKKEAEGQRAYDQLVAGLRKKAIAEDNKWQSNVKDLHTSHEMERNKYQNIIKDLNHNSVEELTSVTVQRDAVQAELEELRITFEKQKELMGNFHSLEGVVALLQKEAQEGKALRAECDTLRKAAAKTQISLEKEELTSKDFQRRFAAEEEKYIRMMDEKTENEANMKKILVLLQDKEAASEKQTREMIAEHTREVQQLKFGMQGVEQDLTAAQIAEETKHSELQTTLQQLRIILAQREQQLKQVQEQCVVLVAERAQLLQAASESTQETAALKQELSQELEIQTTENARLAVVDTERAKQVALLSAQVSKLQEVKTKSETIVETYTLSTQQYEKREKAAQYLLAEEKSTVERLRQQLTGALNELEMTQEKFKTRLEQHTTDLTETRLAKKKLHDLLSVQGQKQVVETGKHQTQLDVHQKALNDLQQRLQMAVLEKEQAVENYTTVSALLQSKQNDKQDESLAFERHSKQQTQLINQIQNMAADWKLRAEESVQQVSTVTTKLEDVQRRLTAVTEENIRLNEQKRTLDLRIQELVDSESKKSDGDSSRLDKYREELANANYANQLCTKTIEQLKAQVIVLSKEPEQLYQEARRLKLVCSKKDVQIASLNTDLQQQKQSAQKTAREDSSEKVEHLMKKLEHKTSENEILLEQLATVRNSMQLQLQLQNDSLRQQLPNSATATGDSSPQVQLLTQQAKLETQLSNKGLELKQAYRQIVELNEANSEHGKIYREQNDIQKQLVAKISAQMVYMQDLQTMNEKLQETANMEGQSVASTSSETAALRKLTDTLVQEVLKLTAVFMLVYPGLELKQLQEQLAEPETDLQQRLRVVSAGVTLMTREAERLFASGIGESCAVQ
jgi:hypothetical protein